MKKIILVVFLIFPNLFANEIFQDGNSLVANGKGVIFIFESDTCPYCDVLKNDFNENEQMQTLAKEFNIYLINKEKEQDYLVGKTKKKETTTTLRMVFTAKTTPNIVMFDKNWNKIFQLPGYASPSQMITFMKFIKGLHEDKYNIEDWEKYLRKNGI